jgi:hypothetical protein
MKKQDRIALGLYHVINFTALGALLCALVYVLLKG